MGTAELFNGETSENSAATTLRASKGLKFNFLSEGSVDVAPLPDIVPTDDLLSARLIKIDVEGAEVATIRGFQDLLGKFSEKTEFVIELTEEAIAESSESTANLVSLFTQHGYGAYQLPNEYSVAPYIRRAFPESPKPYVDHGQAQVDILFSKRPPKKLVA